MSVYCIIGSNRGLGLEFVAQLAKSTDNVILATTRPGADLGDLHTVASTSTHILECDTASVPSIHAFSRSAAHVLQDRTIDVLINSAAINGESRNESSLSLEPAHFSQQIFINVVGPAKIVEFLLDRNVLSPAVRIVNMSSGLGSLQLTAEASFRKCVGYSMSKAALNMLTVHQGRDLRRHLPSAVVIAMDPGWVKTRMGGEGALLEPAESVAGILAVVSSLKDDDNGSFLGRDRKQQPW